jgi:hypothetical protein
LRISVDDWSVTLTYLTKFMGDDAAKDRITSAEARLRGYDRDTIARIELDEEARAEAAQLIPLINRAFASVPRPVITRSVARGYDDEWTLSEDRIRELAAQDPEQTWQEVPDGAMQMCQEYFCFTDAEGMRFYLPAYLCHYLRNFPHCGWDAVYQACTYGQHFDLLSAEQLDCVDRFVELCHRHEVRL